MLTMPSYMGYEGINPLTVHYCYEKDGERELAWVVLEVRACFPCALIWNVEERVPGHRALGRFTIRLERSMCMSSSPV